MENITKLPVPLWLVRYSRFDGASIPPVLIQAPDERIAKRDAEIRTSHMVPAVSAKPLIAAAVIFYRDDDGVTRRARLAEMPVLSTVIAVEPIDGAGRGARRMIEVSRIMDLG